jgi:hypothetical protein
MENVMTSIFVTMIIVCFNCCAPFQKIDKSANSETNKLRVSDEVIRSLQLPEDASIYIWNSHHEVPVTTKSIFLPYLIFIDCPDQVELLRDQKITVRFRLKNLGKKPISGAVFGYLSGIKMRQTPSALINNLLPGAEVTGELTSSGVGNGVHLLRIFFSDGVFSPFAKGVGPLEPILTTKDLPSPGDPSMWQLCGSETVKDEFGTTHKIPREWASISRDPFEITPVAGSFISGHLSDKDFPFAHPFGFDANMSMIPDEDWQNLLAESNSPSDKKCDDKDADKDYCEPWRESGKPSQGILGIETDSLLIPPAYRPPFKESFNKRKGYRMVVHGSWIIDCGHDDHHAEIHPPLLLASANFDDTKGEMTTSFIGRPYSVNQRYLPENDFFFGTCG